MAGTRLSCRCGRTRHEQHGQDKNDRPLHNPPKSPDIWNAQTSCELRTCRFVPAQVAAARRETKLVPAQIGNLAGLDLRFDVLIQTEHIVGVVLGLDLGELLVFGSAVGLLQFVLFHGKAHVDVRAAC